MHANNTASHCVEHDPFVYSTLNDRIDDDVVLGADVVLVVVVVVFDIVELADIVLDVVEVDVALGANAVVVVVDVSFIPEIKTVKTNMKNITNKEQLSTRNTHIHTENARH